MATLCNAFSLASCAGLKQYQIVSRNSNLRNPNWVSETGITSNLRNPNSVSETGITSNLRNPNWVSETGNVRIRTRLSSRRFRSPVCKTNFLSSRNFFIRSSSGDDAYAGVEESEEEEESTDVVEIGEVEEEKKRTVGVFWDLDNKPPKGVPPYKAAIRLRDLASEFGLVVDMVAYANHHAFSYVPQWIRDERQERRRLNILEEQGAVKPDEPYRCQYCGRKCQTYLKLKKHFKQLHERERTKRVSHLNHLKGKKRQRYKEKLAVKEEKYQAIASQLIVPRHGYGLAPELKRAGVYVRTVEDRPQAADEALMKHMTVYINRGLETLILVSDDSDFINILRLASMRNLQTIVIGDTMTLSRHADLAFSWDEVASGRAQDAAAEAHQEWTNKRELIRELEDDSDLYPERSNSQFVTLRPNSSVSAFSEQESFDSDTEDDDDDDEGDRSFWGDDDEDDDEEESVFEDFSPWSRRAAAGESNKVY